MCGMEGARNGSRPHDVSGPESYQRCSIEFAFRVRQKENVLGRQTDLLTDLAVAGGCLLLANAGIEKVLKQGRHISGVGVREEEPLCLF